MESMHIIAEKRRNTKLPIIMFSLFIIGCSALLWYEMKNEGEPIIIGKTVSDIQATIDLEHNALKDVENKEDIENKEIADLNKMYEIVDNTVIYSSDTVLKENLTLPVITVGGKAMSELNAEIYSLFTKKYETYKSSLNNMEHVYNYKVTYNVYINELAGKKILTVTLYERITDSSSGKATTEAVYAYNIDLETSKILEQKDVVIDFLGATYNSKIKEVLQKNISSDYAYTGLETFYFKDGELHFIFNKGDFVDSYKDIIIK